ncbi:Extended synaptotagmin-2 [Hypsibius exemplaris]|uniref:Extended synaptotagmin-2 n=1 Tax=Hypsibius exemplaris TaxID=2072580 RepID=A0A1W0WFU7_HYPEX|nr:Extended synaptotagmin-2 [Hypsibius exemplaris]
MPIFALLLDTVYDICAFGLFKDQNEFGVYWFAAARIVWLVVKWIATPSNYRAAPARTLPELFDFTLDEQKTILESSGKIPSWIHFPDLERVEWLNILLARLWPPFGVFMDKMFKEILEPIIKTAFGSKISFQFDKVDFGSIPVRVNGVKGYKDNVDRKEIMLDWELYYKGDAEFTVYVSGIRAGVKNVQLHGTLRITLKPVLNDMPFVGGVEVYFLNPPVIDFDLTNLLNAPGFLSLKQTVHQQVMDNLKQFTVLPNKISIPFTDIAHKEFLFDLPAGLIRVHVIAGKNLPVADPSLIGPGSSDPYVKIMLGAKEARTKTIFKSLNPKWDEVFDFIVSEAQGQKINFEVYDQDRQQDDFLGKFSVDSGSVRSAGDSFSHWYNISGGSRAPSTGQINLKLSWFDLSKDRADLNATLYENRQLSQYAVSPLSSAVVLVLIDSASALPRVTNSGKDRDPNSSVVLTLGSQTFTTRVVAHSTTPIWEQQTLLYVHNPLTEQIAILLKDDSSPLPIGNLEFPIAALLEADNFAMEAPFPLKGSGPRSAIRLRMTLRLATNAEVRDSYLLAGTPSNTDLKSSLILSVPAPSQSSSANSMDSSNPLVVVKSLNPSTSPDFLTTPRINIALTSAPKSNALAVEIFEACSLDSLWELAQATKQKMYVVCTLLPMKLKQQTGESSTIDNPTFRERLQFSLSPKIELKDCTVHLQVVFGSSMFQKSLGEVKIPLRNVTFGRDEPSWFELLPKGVTPPITVPPLLLPVTQSSVSVVKLTPSK